MPADGSRRRNSGPIKSFGERQVHPEAAGDGAMARLPDTAGFRPGWAFRAQVHPERLCLAKGGNGQPHFRAAQGHEKAQPVRGRRWRLRTAGTDTCPGDGRIAAPRDSFMKQSANREISLRSGVKTEALPRIGATGKRMNRASADIKNEQSAAGAPPGFPSNDPIPRSVQPRPILA